MVLEATVLVIDNSEWMRNGDYTPSRNQAQCDAVNLLFNAKTQSNPENTVALMTMAGKGPEVLVTLTNEFGKILSAMHRIHIAGKTNFSTGIQIAQLVLKHRQNKNQRQRVIVFVGSPIQEDEKDLVRLAKKLKKNNIAVDVVNFGEHEENTSKLETFVTTVNSTDNSHILTVAPGPNLLSDALISSAIVHGEDGPPAGFSGAGFDFGVDPTLDPELAMALRISLEEERARQEAEASRQGQSQLTVANDDDAMAVDTDPLLAQAMSMSMSMGGHEAKQPAGAAPEGMDEDTELQRALLMSMNDDNPDNDDQDTVMQDILGTLPGVDPNDPRIKDSMNKDKNSKK